MNQMLGNGTETFTFAGSALRRKENINISYELGDKSISRANAICFKQETGTLQYNNVHISN